MMDLRMFLVVGIGAALGGMLRLFVTQLVVARAGTGSAPIATMFINVSGSFLIGVVFELASTRAGFHPLWRSFLATGILGGYTTFSTFSLEAMTIASGGALWTSVAYVIGSVVLGILAAILGVAGTRAVSPA